MVTLFQKIPKLDTTYNKYSKARKTCAMCGKKFHTRNPMMRYCTPCWDIRGQK